MGELGDEAVRAIADLVAATGDAEFPDRFLEVLRVLTGTDLCSAFQVEEGVSLRCVFARGEHPQIANFAEAASLDYARLYWGRDRTTRRMLAGRRDDPVHVVRQAWNDIADPEYRRACYERAQVLERLTIYHSDEPRVFASAYRTRQSGPFRPEQASRLEGLAPVLAAALVKHVRLGRRDVASSLHPPLGEVADRLFGAGYALSHREAEVSAGLLLGRTQREISERVGLAVSSIVTYRQRAYRKLGVADQRGLEALYASITKAG